jgi:hypothetical protein
MKATTYFFAPEPGESRWDTVRRLADEVGWHLSFDEASADALRAGGTELCASRARMTRDEYVAALCREAGGLFIAPVTQDAAA